MNAVKGTQVYYFTQQDAPLTRPFAQTMIDNISTATGRGGGEARQDYYYVTRTTVCPSVLFEYGFMVNPQEFEDVLSTDGIIAAACGTANAILASVPTAQ
jgi:N-acetylmuramoyl-L-alanine amidase